MIGGTLLLATRSADKVREIVPMLAGLPVKIVSLEDAGIARLPDEDEIERFDTFEENAAAKADYFFLASGGIPTLADDSGIVIDALGGEPGVRSKRWSARPDLAGLQLDEANNAKLLRELRGSRSRTARYVCVAAFADAGARFTDRGEAAGTILDAPRGAGGFGYDPLFLSDDLGRTFAEAAPAEKSRVSHRGRAFAALALKLRSEF